MSTSENTGIPEWVRERYGSAPWYAVLHKDVCFSPDRYVAGQCSHCKSAFLSVIGKSITEIVVNYNVCPACAYKIAKSQTPGGMAQDFFKNGGVMLAACADCHHLYVEGIRFDICHTWQDDYRSSRGYVCDACRDKQPKLQPGDITENDTVQLLLANSMENEAMMR